MMKILTLNAIIGLASYGFAQQQAGEPHAPPHTSAHVEDHPHPVISENSTWAGVMVIVILVGLFLPAAVIGPIARAVAPEDEPVTNSHDEASRSSHHHGTESEGH